MSHCRCRSRQLVRGEPGTWRSAHSVSRQLAELEKHVRAPLMVRTTRQLALTDAGGDYLETCRSLLPGLPVNVLHRQGRLPQAKVKCFVAMACELLPARCEL